MVKSPRVYVEMNGGLANQLFQWAVVTSMLDRVEAVAVWDYRRALRPNGRGRQLTRLGLDDEPALLGRPAARRFGRTVTRLPPRIGNPLLARLPSIPPARGLVAVTRTFEASAALSAGRSVWIRDYLIDPAALTPHRGSLRDLIRPGLGRTTSTSDRYACVHVRRGDYFDPIVREKLGPCGLDYYVSAIGAIDPTLPVRVVSDDPAWCETDLRPAAGRRIDVLRGGSDLDDLRMIADATAIVMSNSTFSWWGAFLSKAECVIAPSPFFDFDASGSSALLDIATRRLTKAAATEASSPSTLPIRTA